ncbi:MAG TPA: ATP-dependent DNA helicase [Candidatus Mediterraneibacter norfolkensis]|nr:ATP-dependent DNA helicase [Candidatus Mediterraneibacter norfolkensis]
MDREAMLQGGRIHRKIQRRMGSDYHAEVPLKISIPCEDFVIRLEGRADGIIIREENGKETVTIDEIKGVLRDLEYIEHPVGVHLAQAKCYAYIYASQNHIDEISVQMTYCHLDTEEIKRFTQSCSLNELQLWFEDLIGKYKKWAEFQIRWRETRNQSVEGVEFPFPYREGQKDLAVSVYRTILRKKKLFIQAPTGVGKTMAAVFPAVKAVGEELGEKIFYLTAKTITRTVAENAFRTLKEQGLRFKVITLTAKEKICFCEETECNPDACPYAKGHFDRVNDAVYDLISRTDDLSRETIEEQARRYKVCPFELSLDVSVWTDGVICDYNYVFDPNAHLKRFFSESGSGDYIFLIDEAHNLVERGREMYSAALYKEEFLSLKRDVKNLNRKLAGKLDAANRVFLELKKECESCEILESVSTLVIKLMNLLTEMENFLEEFREGNIREGVLDLYFRVRDFLNIYDILDENYVIYSELEPDGRFKVKLYCINPAANLQEYLEHGNSTVFFSATLLPIHYYKKLISVEKEDYAVYAESSFPRENRLLLIGRDVSTRYTQRSREMYRRIASYIRAAAVSKKGNYLAFFPSYRFMEDVYDAFSETGCDMDVILQSQSMGEEERETFLEEFRSGREKSLIGFCVMGGIFAEGIDLAEDRLIGAIIVGPGIPQVCNDREIVKGYFDKRGMDGFDYAYLYPGMNKVLQSAGRVIRTENDRGTILLLDDRFLQRKYREMFPREWNNWKACDAGNAEEYMRRFWEE